MSPPVPCEDYTGTLSPSIVAYQEETAACRFKESILEAGMCPEFFPVAKCQAGPMVGPVD